MNCQPILSTAVILSITLSLTQALCCTADADAVNDECLMLHCVHMKWPHQWHTAEPIHPGQCTKVQPLCKHIHYIRLQSLSSSQIINA